MPADRGGRGTALAVALERAKAAELMSAQLLQTIQLLTSQIVELAAGRSGVSEAPRAVRSTAPRNEGDGEMVDRKTAEAAARLASQRMALLKKNEQSFIDNAKQTLIARGMTAEAAEAEARRIREESVGLIRDED